VLSWSRQVRRPEESWIRREVPALRISDHDLATRVDERLGDRRKRYLAAKARNDGTTAHKSHGRYLLSGGMLPCPTCGAHFEARKYPWRVKEPGGHPGHGNICDDETAQTAPAVPPCCSRRLSYHLYRREQGSSVLVSLDNVRAALPSAVEPGEEINAAASRSWASKFRLSPSSCEDVAQASVVPLDREI